MNRMRLMRGLILCATALAVTMASAQESGKKDEKKPKYKVLAQYVSPDDSLSQIRFLNDGQVSLNNQCPVRRVRLNIKMPAAYVNGRPVGFC
jgi:hypothetical protein